MSSTRRQKQLDHCLEALRGSRTAGEHRKEIVSVVETVIDSLEDRFSPGELHLYKELEGLARFIKMAKAEIASIRPDKISGLHIPEATIELDAIVGAAEQATSTILDCAEEIESAVADLPKEVSAKVTGAVTAIYEACNFQDITGQRTTKVVRAIKMIEEKIGALVEAFGDQFSEDDFEPEDDETAANPGELLSGPQNEGQGISQSDIDALLAD